jgi:hypothetical protein
MIAKTIKVGPGVGPAIDMSRYKNARVSVNGLKDGLVTVHTNDGAELITSADGWLPVLDETQSIHIDAQTNSCVVVKLTAEAL